MKLVLILTVILGASSAQSPDIVPIPGGLSGDGTTTRYWDCCKPSCAWKEAWPSNTTETKIPARSCAIDGATTISPNAQSGCETEFEGTAFSCNNQVAWVVNSTLAYGFSAGSFAGGVDNSMCCTCMLLNFQGELSGKSFLVQITNTGSDLGKNHFDLAIPGGGVGIFAQGCIAQWGAGPDGWGDRYGGVTSEAECISLLPAVLQDGCKFRFDFMEGVSNPPVSFYQVQCPSELTAITGCEVSV